MLKIQLSTVNGLEVFLAMNQWLTKIVFVMINVNLMRVKTGVKTCIYPYFKINKNEILPYSCYFFCN